MSAIAGPNVITNGLRLSFDAGNIKSYPKSGNTWSDSLNTGYSFELTNPSFYSYVSDNSGFLSFDRNMPPDSENGGYGLLTLGDDLTVQNYMGNDNTTEVWYKIDDLDPTGYDAQEQNSALVVYKGYHTMFEYSPTTMYYRIWGDNGAGGWTTTLAGFNHSSTEGKWNQVVGQRSGNDLLIYHNGIFQDSTTITFDTSTMPTSNFLRVACGNLPNENYAYLADVNVSKIRMYKRALSASEIKQNFEATRGRYGI